MKKEGSVALVTGAGRGIGKAIALGLARETGAAVAVVARTESEIRDVASEISRNGGRAIAVRADLLDRQQIERSVETTEKELGPIDILVNNGGDNHLGLLEEQDPDEWWRIVDVNLRATHLYCRGVVPSMRERRWGRIINVSSIAGKKGSRYCSAYSAAKHGVIGLTRSLALEVADCGVTVNAVCPGFVRTKLTEQTYEHRARLMGGTREEIEQWVIDAVPQRVALSPDDLVFRGAVSCVRWGEVHHRRSDERFGAGLVMH